MLIVVYPCESAVDSISRKKLENSILVGEIEDVLLASLPPVIIDQMPSEANLSNYFNRQFTKKITLADYQPNESILILSEEPNRKFLSFFNRSNTSIYISAALTAETEFSESNSPDFLYFVPPGQIVTVSTAVPVTPLSAIFTAADPEGYLIIGIGYLDPQSDNGDNNTQYP